MARQGWRDDTHECMDVQSNRCLHEHMANIDIDYVFNLSKLIIKDVCVSVSLTLRVQFPFDNL